VVEYLKVLSHVGLFFGHQLSSSILSSSGKRYEVTVSSCDRFSQQPLTGVAIMSGQTDEMKGRVKEAVGAVTDINKLRAEGQTDQAVGKVEQVAEKAVDKVKKAVKKLPD
jgi:uncharacterized protein YjbJ (UPF0337 family)